MKKFLIGVGALSIAFFPLLLIIGLFLFLFLFLTVLDDDGGKYNAFCNNTGEIDMVKVTEVFDNAGLLAGTEDLFIYYANEYEIDPVLMMAISLHETGYGTSNALRSKNNPGGLMDPYQGSRVLMSFPTLEDGIEAMARTLHNRIIRDGLNTVEKLANVYAPIGADNDPHGLNQHWLPNVLNIANDLGGLIMNCDGDLPPIDGAVFEIIMHEALKYEGWPYSWGGSNPATGFDCSGFTQWVYKQAGINLPRTAYTQYLHATPISREQLQPGDLIFFDTADYAPVTHVGIYVGNGLMYDSNNGGIGYSNAFDSYWGPKIVGYGRVINSSN